MSSLQTPIRLAAHRHGRLRLARRFDVRCGGWNDVRCESIAKDAIAISICNLFEIAASYRRRRQYIVSVTSTRQDWLRTL
jgi:hypothetical protein